MLCAEKAGQCSSCSATAQLNIAPLVSNRPEILQSATAIILTLLIQFVRICYSPQCAGTAAATQLHRTPPCQLSLSVISTGEGRVWMLSRRLCCATRRGWRRWRPSWKNKTISRQPPPQLQLVPLSPPRPRRLASPMMVFLRSSATDYNNYDFITTPTVNLTCDGEIDSFILQPLTKRQYSKSLMNITNKHKQANKFIDAK